ncbi:Tetratricopeptide-like helical domain superfamily [Sesbania bispinosa]|nr:Tetratricopeptide-like helical domain superfamily [Sesbania bispinosa]
MKDLLSRNPSDPLLISQLGYIQLQTGDLEGVKVSFLKLEGEWKNNGSLSEVEYKNLVNQIKALVYMAGKDYVSAVREYEECIERDPSDVVAINNKAFKSNQKPFWLLLGSKVAKPICLFGFTKLARHLFTYQQQVQRVKKIRR